MNVTKRNGTTEEVDSDKIYKRIRHLVNEPYRLKNVDILTLAQKVKNGLFDGIETSAIDVYTADLAASMAVEHREYGVLAGRIVVSNHHKKTLSSFKDKMDKLYLRQDVHGNVCPLLDGNFYKFVKKNQKALDKYIDYSRDYLMDFFGFKTLEKSYLMRCGDEIVERPQDVFMRVAIFLHMNPKAWKSKDVLERIFESYDYMSQRYFTHATPTLFNAGTTRPQLLSCFPKGARVFTINRGPVNIEEVVIGDSVVTHKGRIRNVEQIHENILGDRNIFDIKCYMTPEFKVTGNHRFWSISAEDWNRKRKPSWNSIEYLRCGDFIALPKCEGSIFEDVIDVTKFTFEHPFPDREYVTITFIRDGEEYCLRVTDGFVYNTNPIKRFIKIDEKFAKFLGIWYINGGRQKKNGEWILRHSGIDFTVNTNDQDVIDFLTEFSEEYFGIPILVYPHKNQNCTKLVIRCPLLGDIFIKLFGHLFNGKKMWNRMYKWSESLIKQLIIGMFCSDGGCITKTGILTLTLSNGPLTEGIYNLCRRVGMLVSLSKNGYNYRMSFASGLPLTEELRSLCLKHYADDRRDIIKTVKFVPYKIINGVVFVRLMKKELDKSFNDKFVYTLGVDEDHSYTVNGLVAENCFLLGSSDSIEGILQTVSDCAKISKASGGIGFHFDWRSKGSLIRGTNGTSDGAVPFLKIFNDTARAFNQGGGKRKGSFAAYMEPHNPDILDFLKIRRPIGEENLRCPDLFIALWISDLFMKRMLANEMWSLFDSDRCPGLTDVYGEEYEQLYLDYEEKKMYTEQIPAREILNAAFLSQKESGLPYICFKDNVNRSNNQSNVGVIKSSNLCVSGDTEVLVREGYRNIQELVKSNKGKHEVWNGEQWSMSQFAQTSDSAELLKITFSDGCELKCTPYHEFIVVDGSRNEKEKIVEAKKLRIGTKLIRYSFPVVDTSTLPDFPYAYTHGFFCGDGTYYKPTSKNETCPSMSKTGELYCGKHRNMYGVVEGDSEYCVAEPLKNVPVVSLYGDKMNLLPYMDREERYNIGVESHNNIRINLPHDLPEKFIVPMEYSIKSKLEWLSGLLDADGALVRNGQNQSFQLGSIHRDFLLDVKKMCNTLGINPILSKCRDECERLMPDGRGGEKLYTTKTLYRLLFSSGHTMQLYQLGLSTKRHQHLSHVPNRGAQRFIRVKSIETLDDPEPTYCFNEPLKHRGIFNGVLSSQCSEIVEYSSDDEYACCSLSSICLPMFVEDTYTEEEAKLPEEERRELDHEFPLNPIFNYRKLEQVVAVVTRNLNQVVDRNWYPVPQTKKSNMRHRPLGIGVQGLADVFFKFKTTFDSEIASDLNRRIFETMYYAGLTASTKQSREIYLSHLSTIQEKGSVTIDKVVYGNEKDQEKLPMTIGAYSTFEGSPLSKGQYHFEMRGLTTKDCVQPYDWETLRSHIQTFGVRNSLLIALMPTASTSQIMGNTEGIDPLTSNIYSRGVLAGSYLVINKYLIHDLEEIGLWNDEVRECIKMSGSSIQNIEGLPDELKNRYRTVWELPQKSVIDLAADRQHFVDQSQSMNLHIADLTLSKFSAIISYGWKKGLKTGCYYLRSRPAAEPQKFTVNPNHQTKQVQQVNYIPTLDDSEQCLVCSG